MPGWTIDTKRYETSFGTITYGGPCKDDYVGMQIYDQPGSGTPVKLQGPAMRSFRAAEERATPRWLRRKDRVRPIILTGSWRDCDYQKVLYVRDPNRYAKPEVTAHCRGLAIDVSTKQGLFRRRKIHRALTRNGWRQVRPDDEPWHYSYFVTV
jgi:hypothetical protein